MLASRYRIVRFVAGGGMGEVYEAEDLQLGGSVALKIVRAPLEGDRRALDHLKHEIQLARKVTHPNVCRLFEFGLHAIEAGGGEAPRQVAFLTMELLAGESLEERLRRAGPLPLDEALVVAEQMAAALAAAHRAGVVHRDFKTANVVLSPGPDRLRVVVTDFGLARDRSGQGLLARDGEPIIGTPDYMAPEQIAGAEVGPFTDVYAFGLVLHEMVTGRRPFSGGISGALKRLDGEAPPLAPLPRASESDLERSWERVIARCLARAPRDRFTSPQDAVRELREARAGIVDGRRRRGLGLAALLLVVVGVGFALRPRPPAPSAPPPSLQVRPSLAVLPFKDLGARPSTVWLSTALAEMLSAELAAGGGIRIVPGENVARLKAELGLADAEALTRDTLTRIRSTLGADVIVFGSYLAADGEGDRLRLDVRVDDTRAGETIVVVSEQGTTAGVLDLVSRASARLREAMGMSGLPSSAALGVRASLPSTPEAMRYHAEGLGRLRAFDAKRASELLQRAVAAEPLHPLPHAALAEAWALLGYEDEARAEIQRALELSSGLPREARLAIEARHREASRDWPEAVRTYDVLFTFFPDNVEHGLRLVAAQTAAGRVADAGDTLALLRRLPAPASQDPRIDLAEASAAEARGDLHAQLASAQRALARARARGERLLEARALLHQAYASGRLGRPEWARAATDEARRFFEQAGDIGGVALALNRGGNVLLQAGRTLEAREQYRTALETFERIGYRGGAAAAASNLHLVLLFRGALTESGRHLELARSIDAQSGNRRGLAFDLGNRSLLLYEGGELRSAEQALREATAQVQALNEVSVVAIFEQRTADTLAAMGRLDEAAASYENALASLRKGGSRHYATLALSGKAGLLRQVGDLRGSRALYEEALRARKQLGDVFGESECRLALARLALDEARPKEVAELLKPALIYYAAEQLTDGEGQARALLADAFSRQGPATSAREEAQRALSLVARSEVPRVFALTALAVARASREVEVTGSRAALGRALELTHAHGFGALALELRLEQARLRRDHTADDRHLAELEQEAKQRGFRLLERMAAQERLHASRP